MVKGKKAWIRILEAAIAILIIVGVLLVVYSRNVGEKDLGDYMYQLQREVLKDISLNDELRAKVFADNEIGLEEYAREKIPTAFDFDIRICKLVDESTKDIVPCKMTHYVEKDVYAEEIIVAGDFNIYEPRKVRLFVWESEGE